MVNPLQMPSLGSSGFSVPGASSSGGLGGGLSIPGMGGGGLSSLTGGMSGMSGIGGGAPGLDAGSLQSAGVSSSTLMLMSQINTMMASVMTGLMAFMQQVMASAAQRQQQQATAPGMTPGGSPGGSPGSTGSPGGSPGGPNTMTPASSSGSITKLSDDKETRLKQVVDAAKRMFPNQPHLAKLAAAQAVLESGLNGSPSSLASQHNNLFGIKGKGTAGSVNLGTQEEANGSMYSTTAGFAKNATLEDSFKQHRDLLTGNSRYAKVVSAGSFEDAARLVREAGYATDSAYPQKLISIYNGSLAKYF